MRPPSAGSATRRRAWVELAPDRGADSLAVEIAHVLDQAILDGLRISVDGSRLPHALMESDGAVVASPAEAPAAARPGKATRVTVEVDRTVRPCDINPASHDDRQLSIAVRRIAFGRS